MEQIEALNRAIFIMINAGPSTSTWVIHIAILVADDLIYLIPALLLAMWLRGDKSSRNLAIKAGLVALIGVGLNQIIGVAWQHPRPFMIGLGHVWLPHVPDSSFPSDHMTVFNCIGLSLLMGRSVRPGLVTLAVGLCVAWARIFLGLHFPLDMIGAIGVACMVHAMLSPVWRKMGDQLTSITEQMYWKVMALPIARGWIRH